MKTLVVVEHDNEALKHSTLSVLTAAEMLPAEIIVLIIGFQCKALAHAFKKNKKIEKIIFVDAPEYQYQLAENTAAIIAKLAPNYNYILAPATTFGKNCLPRAAALCDSAMISDVIKIIDAHTFVRPIYAGNAFETVQLDEKIKFITVRPAAFQAVFFEGESIPEEGFSDPIPQQEKSRFISHELSVSLRPDLQNARIIVSGGRGLQSKENFKLIEKLADKLNAAIGASRAAVDAGFISNDFQVGQTGKIVAPDLYIAIGISGAIQHLAGMKDSKVVVAINKDADAPIFQVADYGLVGDLFEIVPLLITELEKG